MVSVKYQAPMLCTVLIASCTSLISCQLMSLVLVMVLLLALVLLLTHKTFSVQSFYLVSISITVSGTQIKAGPELMMMM